ncbi:Golgi transport complex subunit 4 [Microbotryomycetes sp. JL221]|nr:Golgi transport complex subunit 4 [Microbotryomycetes sp. JL221]
MAAAVVSPTSASSSASAPPGLSSGGTGLASDVDLASLTTRSAIQAHLTQLSAQEARVDELLTTSLNSRAELTRQLKALQGLRHVVDTIENEAIGLSNEVRVVAETAERVGGKVRVLDEEQSRVKDSIEVVQAVQELKTSITTLDEAMQRQDWEAATRAMQRASAIDPDIVKSGFAEAVVPTVTLPLVPAQTLATLRASLLETFTTSFREAAAVNDTNNINRYFKLFPSIGEEDKGLAAYAEWVSGIVRTKTGSLSGKSQSPTHFATLLTALFESIALIISQHQPVVEKYYGPGKMTSVAASLVTEADTLGIRVVRNWEEERQVRKRLIEAASYKFGSSINKKKINAVAGPATPVVGQQDDEPVDTREVDALLAELAMMSGRWQLLRRFLHESLSNNDEDGETTNEKTGHEMTDQQAGAAENPDTDLEMMKTSELGKTIATHLKNVYHPLEAWYLRSTVERAHQMDELDTLAQPPLSSSLDDTFYILKKTVYRLLSTSSVETVLSMFKDVRQIMERDVADVWRMKLDGAFKDVGNVGGVGRAREEEKDRREKEARAQFIVYLNNLDTAAEYAVRLVEEVLAGETLQDAFFLEPELERAKIAVLQLRGTEDKFRSVLKVGLDHLFNQLLRPKLRPLLIDMYKDVSYVLDEDAYAEAEYRDEVRKRFIRSWEALLSGYKESMTATNFNSFFATSVNVLVRPWEGIIRNMKFTELGALRLDRDIRSILSYLSNQSSFASGSLRESFSRLQQIATLLTLDSPDEAEEVLSASGNRLTQGEVKTSRTAARPSSSAAATSTAKAQIKAASPSNQTSSDLSASLKRAKPSSDTSSSQPAKRLAPIFAQSSINRDDESMAANVRFTETLIGTKSSCWTFTWLPNLWEPAKKVLALDIDGTLITTKTGNNFPRDETDWKFWDLAVTRKLDQARQQGFSIVFFSNQATKPVKQEQFKIKMRHIGERLRLTGHDFPFKCYAAFGYDKFRKPAPGMWDAFISSPAAHPALDLAQSKFVGDAAGRLHRGLPRKRDHSDSDRKFAMNIGLTFMTPEEFFLDGKADPEFDLLGWDPRTYDHTRPLYLPTHVPLATPFPEFGQRQPEVVIFVGPPGAGKTTLYQTHFAPLDYAHVLRPSADHDSAIDDDQNQDTLKTRQKCLDAVRQHLSTTPPRSCVVDNTSPSLSVRSEYINLVRNEFPQAQVRIVYFDAPIELGRHNSAYRAMDDSSGRGALPDIAFSTYRSRFEMPKQEVEDFDMIHTVSFRFDGDAVALAKWARWLDLSKQNNIKKT